MKIVQIQERKIIVVVETDEYEKFTHSVYCLFSLLCFLLKIFAFGFELFFHTHRNIIPKEFHFPEFKRLIITCVERNNSALDTRY